MLHANGNANKYPTVREDRIATMKETLEFVFRAAGYLQRNGTNEYKLIICWAWGTFGLNQGNARLDEARLKVQNLYGTSDFARAKRDVQTALNNLAELTGIRQDVDVSGRSVSPEL